MKIIFSVCLIIFSTFAFCDEIEEQITLLVKKYAREESIRVSNETNVSGAFIANKGQLINTCKGHESQTGDKLGSNQQIKIEKIYYLGTLVKKLEEYKNYPYE